MMSWINKNEPRYSIGEIVTFNLSGNKTYSFLSLGQESGLLYRFAYIEPKHNISLDTNGNIYLDTCSDSFQYIHDYLKKYKITFTELSMNVRLKLHEDCVRYGINGLRDMIIPYIPSFDDRTLFSNIIAQNIINIGNYCDSFLAKLDTDVSIRQELMKLFQENKTVIDSVNLCSEHYINKQHKDTDLSSLIFTIILELSKNGDIINAISNTFNTLQKK